MRPQSLGTSDSKEMYSPLGRPMGTTIIVYKDAVKDAQKICLHRSQLREQRTACITINVKQATRFIRASNLSKGACLLTGGCTSADPQAFSELQEKHPQDVPPALFAPDYSFPTISSQMEEELEHLLLTTNLARVLLSPHFFCRIAS
jgi:hypothetical protein